MIMGTHHRRLPSARRQTPAIHAVDALRENIVEGFPEILGDCLGHRNGPGVAVDDAGYESGRYLQAPGGVGESLAGGQIRDFDFNRGHGVNSV